MSKCLHSSLIVCALRSMLLRVHVALLQSCRVRPYALRKCLQTTLCICNHCDIALLIGLHPDSGVERACSSAYTHAGANCSRSLRSA